MFYFITVGAVYLAVSFIIFIDAFLRSIDNGMMGTAWSTSSIIGVFVLGVCIASSSLAWVIWSYKVISKRMNKRK